MLHHFTQNSFAEIAVVGGGAAGFFAAIHAAAHLPKGKVVLFEKTSKLLSKVKISGGGRCNLTHACFSVQEMSKNYPRGEKIMKKLLPRFMTNDTIEWFESRGVLLKTEADGRVFPISDNSQTIVDLLIKEAQHNGVKIFTSHQVTEIIPENGLFKLQLSSTGQVCFYARKVIVATGGNSKLESFQWLARLGHCIEPPVPSLFTFNMPQENITQLQGISLAKAIVKIIGTDFIQCGPLLITHWGMSGPAVLKLSAWAARWIAEKNYHFSVLVRWVGDADEASLRQQLAQHQFLNKQKQLGNSNPVQLPARLWEFLLCKAGIQPTKTWQQAGKGDFNKIVNILRNDVYQVSGKTTYKEEFVTCGGVSVEDIYHQDLQSKKLPGLYFAGEVLDIDGITGGFNFQAAWTTGYIAGTSAARSLNGQYEGF
ncbi:MAG: NAD(P)/FAD-dependent oxidoreductase [Cytophagales bacterium]|nr:NAD(P)/FAD-dependent oxidoreductase [Bernardetiaceae bacterium]MDW8210849.1 NAD(P)/FAD-dependent oxidoreductase [Cytophagales bacterium]